MPRTVEAIDRELIAVSHKRDRAEQSMDYEEFAAQDMLLDQLLDERAQASHARDTAAS